MGGSAETVSGRVLSAARAPVRFRAKARRVRRGRLCTMKRGLRVLGFDAGPPGGTGELFARALGSVHTQQTTRLAEHQFKSGTLHKAAEGRQEVGAESAFWIDDSFVHFRAGAFGAAMRRDLLHA